MKQTDLWETPQDLFNKLDYEFHFCLDAAATGETKKCKKFLGPGSPIGEDAFKRLWSDFVKEGEAIWLNPPFSREGKCKEFLYKAIETGHFRTLVVLSRLDPSTKWFHDCLYYAYELRIFKHRIKFLMNGVVGASPNFNCCLWVFKPNAKIVTPIISFMD